LKNKSYRFTVAAETISINIAGILGEQ